MRLDHDVLDLWPVRFFDSREDVQLALLDIDLQQIYPLNAFFANYLRESFQIADDTLATDAVPHDFIEQLGRRLSVRAIFDVFDDRSQYLALVVCVGITARLARRVWVKNELCPLLSLGKSTIEEFRGISV